MNADIVTSDIHICNIKVAVIQPSDAIKLNNSAARDTIHSPVLRGSASLSFFKHPRKVTLALKTNHISYIDNVNRRIEQQSFPCGDTCCGDKIAGRLTCFIFKNFGKVGNVQVYRVSHILQRYLLIIIILYK